MARQGKPPELAIPVASLAALRTALANEVGADNAARALSAAGHAAGDALFTQLDDVESLSETDFWRKIANLLGARGWGTLAHSDLHDGVGALAANDWVEANPEANANRPSCFFTTGMLANLLGNAAGSPVAVLEVECRSRGDAHCRFLFGSTEAMQALYNRVGAGQPIETALQELA
jgi:predicted hydrocarbon binding protein